MWQPTPGIALALFEFAPDAILIIDYQDGRFLACNRQAQALLGYTTEEILALSPGQISPEYQPGGLLSADLIERDIQLALHEGTHTFDWTHRHKDGGLIPTEVHLLRLPDPGQPERQIFRASILDLRPRFLAERQLIEREEYMTRILESPGLIVFSLDREYCYTAFNTLHAAVMKTIWGVDISIGMNMLSIIHHEKDQEKAKENFDRALSGEEFIQIEEYGDEEIVRTWYEDFYSPQRATDGSIIGLTVFVKDITSQKQYEAKLAYQNIQLMQINEELNTLVYHTSHDLRAPIASLQGLMTLLDMAASPEEQTTYKGLINKQLKRLDLIIQDIIDLRKLRATEINPGKIELYPFVQEIIESVKFSTSDERISIRLESLQDQEISTDKYYLKIILNNLISNAFKYQDPYRNDPYIEINCLPMRDGMMIRVADNGIGIPYMYQHKVFDIFFRATAQNVGTGIGLYITKGAVQKLGGSIRFTSEEGSGTIFEVFLPNQASI